MNGALEPNAKDGTIVAKTIKDDLSDRSTWTRLLYMILFAVIFNVTELVAALVVVFQFLSRLFTGRTNAELRGLGNTLGAYLHEIVAYLTYHSEDRPYPFGPWPAQASSAPGAQKPAPARVARSRKPKAKPDPQPPESPADDSKD